MATLADVEVAIRAKLGPLEADSKKIEQRVVELEKKLVASANRIDNLNKKLIAEKLSAEDKAAKRSVDAAEKAAKKKADAEAKEATRSAQKQQALAEKTAATQAALVEKARVASEKANEKAAAAAEKAAKRQTIANEQAAEKARVAAEKAAQKAIAAKERETKANEAAAKRAANAAVAEKKREESAATRAANKKIAEAERAARAEAAAANKSALAEERAKRRATVAAEKAARDKARAAQLAAAQEAKGGFGGFLSRQGGAMVGGLIAGVGVVEAAKAAKELVDAYTKVQNSLKVAGLEGENLTQTYRKLLQVAKDNAAPIESLTDLYSKASLVQNDLGASQERLMTFTTNTAKALRVSGRTTVEARGALLQLGQALSSSTVRAEEFNSIQEGALPILQAVAAGMARTGGSVAKLRNLVINGEVSSKEFFDAFEKGAVILDKQLSGNVLTIDQGFTQLRNTLIDVSGRLNEMTGASGVVGESLGKVASILENLVLIIEKAKKASDDAPEGGWWDLFSKSINSAASNVTNTLIPELQAAIGLIDTLADSKKMNAIGDFLFIPDDVNDNLEDTKEEIRDVYSEMDKLFDRVQKQKIGLGNFIPEKTLDDFLALRNQIKQGGMATEDARQAIIKFAEDHKEVALLPGLFNPLIDKLLELLGVQKELNTEVEKFNRENARVNPGKQDSTFKGWQAQSDFREKEKFLKDRLENSEGGKAEKQLDKRQKEILDEAKKQGVTLTAIEARIQAALELKAEKQADFSAKVAANTSELIKQFEGFSSTPYWDVNAYRAGYGSDTVTLDDGSIVKITKGMTVSLEDAERDLARRIGEFQDVIRGQIGGGRFDSMSENQQAALTSIAYNYGSLPQRIVEAIKTGNNETIYGAIRGLSGDNKGVNSKRRMKEAEVFAGSGFASDFEKPFAAKEDFAEMIQREQQELEVLREKNKLLGETNPLIEDYSGKAEQLEKAEELLAKAQREGVAAGKELSSVQELLFGDLSKLTPEAREQAEAMRAIALGAGEAAGKTKELKDSQKALAESSKEFREFSKGLLSGFISDLREGKSATEALANALNKVADKLLDMALDSFFGTGSAAKGGGMLGNLFGGGGGGILGGLFSFLGFASGTENTGGTRGEPRGVVHGQEAVIPLPNGGNVPVDINVPSGLSNPQFSGGGKQAIEIELTTNTDTGVITEIARTEIKGAAPNIVSVSVKESQKQTKQNMPGLITQAQSRSL